MRLVVYYFSVIFFLLFSFISGAQTQAEDVSVNGPEIRFENKRMDFGDVLYRKDSTYVYRFAYENTGSAPLIVNQVVGHCPCVTIRHSTEPLPPAGRDTLSVYFKPSRASKYTQQITVFNNSSDDVVTLYAKGNFLKLSEWKSKTKPNSDE